MRAIEVTGVDLPEGWQLLAIKPFSVVPGDEYLSIIAAQSTDSRDFVTWIYNWQQRGAGEDRYTDCFETMMIDFHLRGSER